MGISSLTAAGRWNPAALNVEWDIPVAPFHSPDGSTFLKIWGLGLADVGNGFDLNGMNIKVFGGMSKGLPLVKHNQSGMLISGSI
jgi:hypothetical protein